MAGVKGRSGGKRPGAGRKPAPAKPVAMPRAVLEVDLGQGYDDPARFLRDMMNNSAADAKLRLDAAKALMPFTHAKPGEAGKKDEQADKAKKAGQGRFKAAPAPLKLVRQ